MPDTRDAQSVIDAAEQAAAAGDYPSAEELLRQAALLQEASLGSLHPDLANTLNNLGVVCEITEKPADAERCFRRACAIAAAALAPDHPFVATSRKNLEDFCAARGITVDSPVASRRSSRLPVIALIAAGVFVALIAAATWFGSTHPVQSSPESRSALPPSPAPAGSPPVAPIAPTAPTEPETKGSRPADAGPKATAAERRTAGTSVPQPPVVAAARLCRELSTGGLPGLPGDWHCEPPSLPIGSGSLFFYTRLKSPTVTTVQHRWYRDDRLRQVVELPIRANTTGGYRTYSRHTVDNQGAGEWRVELRTRDGVLLHEERFLVR
jgi:hypothetical protein